MPFKATRVALVGQIQLINTGQLLERDLCFEEDGC